MPADKRAITDQKGYYDDRYSAGYMDGFEYDVYEQCRLYTIRKVLPTLGNVDAILDYGCGQGRYLPEVARFFPRASLYGCDISKEGISLAQSKVPRASFLVMDDERVSYADDTFDLVISIEVLEHVQDIALAVREISRVLKPGGCATITTPCANRYSLEWFLNWRRNGLQPSHDGYGRFASDEPGHLRRLTSQALTRLFETSGCRLDHCYFRSHLFTTLLEQRSLSRRLAMKTRAKISLWDWHLFRHFSNGATMLAIFRK